MVRQVQAADELEAGGLEWSAIGIGIASSLMIIALDRVRLDAGADVGQRLFRVAPVGRGEGLPLPASVVAGLREGNAFGFARRGVRGEEQPDFRFEGDAEGVLV